MPRTEPFGSWLVVVAIGVIVSELVRVTTAYKDFGIISEEDPDLFDSAWFFSVYSVETLIVFYGLEIAALFFAMKRILPPL